MSDCPCDLQSKEECDICRDTDTIKKGEQRKMTTTALPRENTERVQEILNDGTMSLEEKSKSIYSYDNACLSRENDRRKPDPKLSVHQILMVLVERCR